MSALIPRPNGRVKTGIFVEVDLSVVEWLDRNETERAVLSQFVALMLTELAANDGKGNRPDWYRMDRKQAVAEVHWHSAKLAVAAKHLAEQRDSGARDTDENEGSAVREYAADTANCALMVLDVMDLLDPAPKENPNG